MSEKGKTVDLVGAWTVQDVLLCLESVDLFRIYCLVCCGCIGEDHGLGRCLNCSGCTTVSEKGTTVDLMLGLLRMYCFVFCGWKGEDHRPGS